MSSADVEIQMGPVLGIPGKHKAAYTVDEATTPGDPANFIVPVGTDLRKVCMVEYKDLFLIEKFIEAQDYTEFTEKMHYDIDFKFYMDFYRKLTKKKEDNDYESYLKENHLEFLEYIETKNDNDLRRDNYYLDKLVGVYSKNEDFFNCIAELAKMHEFGIRSLSPKILKIRIVLGTINEEENKFTPEYYGIPFDPSSNIKEQIIKLIRANIESYEDETITHFQISYLMEKCDEDIVQYYNNIADPEIKQKFLEDMGNAINDFVEKFVDQTSELNCDFKLANLCPNYSNGNISVNILDIDPRYSIRNLDNDPNFNKHAKTFMKFLVFVQSDLFFTDWFVTQKEVDDMIVFFHDIKYSKYDYNPINMLYFYIVDKSDFLTFTKLLYHYNPLNIDSMLSLKQKFRVPPGVEHKSDLSSKAGGGSSSFKKGGKKTKRRNSRKRKRRTRRTK